MHFQSVLFVATGLLALGVYRAIAIPYTGFCHLDGTPTGVCTYQWTDDEERNATCTTGMPCTGENNYCEGGNNPSDPAPTTDFGCS